MWNGIPQIVFVWLHSWFMLSEISNHDSRLHAHPNCKCKKLYYTCIYHKVTSSPCWPRSRVMEAERMPRSRFRNVNADSHSDIILVTEDGSPAIVSDDPIASAAWESLRFLKLPKNCHNKNMKWKKWISKRWYKRKADQITQKQGPFFGIFCLKRSNRTSCLSLDAKLSKFFCNFIWFSLCDITIINSNGFVATIMKNINESATWKTKKKKKVSQRIPLVAYCMLPTIGWQLAQSHEAVEPPSCVSMDEFPNIKVIIRVNSKNEHSSNSELSKYFPSVL